MEIKRIEGRKVAGLAALLQPVDELWYSGEWDEGIFTHTAAVVGSRRMTQYGQRVVEKLVPQLVSGGVTVISGMMYGVDQAAHRACMECGGRTVAVLGFGLKWPGISTNDLRFMDEIVKKGGLVVSEWENQPGTLWTFPMRDRIMAALAQEIYVVEAAAKSGSLITAEWGVKLGRKVWAVPGPVTSKVSEGTNRLIADGKAQMWLPQQQISLSLKDRDTNNAEIYAMLQNETLGIDDLARKLKRPVEELGAKLSLLVLSGEIIEKEGKYFLGSGNWVKR
ncbi:MAG: Transcriptional regulator, MarR family [Candidatus Amesbacteria bacterium GW2011_GWA2_47_11]|uniref:Transcriptional regulator, MarR family n=1 Tax=Candidatus Amesbacteria bacterium GW2011_GWA2_47_11 TaxID=1618357 RepID=A0A0G1RFY1_9BACT|nr:MAG: Transcriptional regulator, MarR family [Candidatus Amesbacteria bacterium GW2011_GWA2_47_11]